MSWDDRFIRIAHTVASWSKDPDKQVGCVLVSPDKRKVSWGYNGPAAGVDIVFSSKEEKNKYTLHAEVNALLNSSQEVHGWTMYVTECCCIHCASAAIQAGIGRVVVPYLDSVSSWYADQLKALHLLQEQDIKVTHYVREKV